MILLNLLVGFWLIVTGTALVYSIRLLRRSRRAIGWLKGNDLNGYRLIVADGALHRGYIRISMAADMVLMGLLSGAAQFFPLGGDVRQVISAVFRLLFIYLAIAFLYKAYLEDHELDLLMNEDERRSLRTRRTDLEGDDGSLQRGSPD